MIGAWFLSTILTMATWMQATALLYMLLGLVFGNRGMQMPSVELASRLDEAFWFISILLTVFWIRQRRKKRKAEA